MPKKTAAIDLAGVLLSRVSTRLITAPDFQLVLNPLARVIWDRITPDKDFVQLGDITISTQGLAGNRFALKPEKSLTEKFPFLSKGQARRYELEASEIQFTSMDDKPSLVRFYRRGAKLLIRRVISRQDRLLVGYTEQEMVFKKDINPFLVIDSAWNPKFVLGVLNSGFVSWLYLNSSSIAAKDDFRQTTLAELRRIPIPAAYKNNKQHDTIVVHVERMLKLHEDLASVKSPDTQTRLQRDIAATDRAIDQLVYQLYDLTPEEIALVESATDPVALNKNRSDDDA